MSAPTGRPITAKRGLLRFLRRVYHDAPSLRALKGDELNKIGAQDADRILADVLGPGAPDLSKLGLGTDLLGYLVALYGLMRGKPVSRASLSACYVIHPTDAHHNHWDTAAVRKLLGAVARPDRPLPLLKAAKKRPVERRRKPTTRSSARGRSGL